MTFISLFFGKKKPFELELFHLFKKAPEKRLYSKNAKSDFFPPNWYKVKKSASKRIEIMYVIKQKMS